ncbi:MFS transporter [Nocardioides jishulii]|uniref:MFS transporter n=1 Tax=Nocardioides jishulii TaxID=2575440 RepID=UPI001EF15555|nr:MFS transporter [Nocardioides jishulii]
MTGQARPVAPPGTRALLALAAIAVAFAAADTYVVVLALPDMMGSAGIPIDQLQRAAPIVSSFLLGYVAMLPLIGRIADLHGRVPVLVLALAVFAVGSLVTAMAYDLPSMVVGRFFQGVGGGALVPATLALVADLYPADRRGVPLGVVSAVQEAGSVLGPLLGAAVLVLSDWRAIFALNLAVACVLAAALRVLATRRPQLLDDRARALLAERRARSDSFDLLGAALLLLTLVAAGLVVLRPAAVMRDLVWGEMFVPFVPDGRWLSPVGSVAMFAALLFVLRLLTARRPLFDVRPWLRAARDADLVGSAFLAVALGGVILAFATADPKVQLFAEQGEWYLLGAALATVCLVVHLRRAHDPLIPRGTFSALPASGALVVSFLVGAALIAAVVDIPLFARTTVHSDSQLMAGLVLVRFLIALPVGAVAGGWLTRWWGSGPTTALGMALAAGAFAAMSRWGLDALEQWHSSVSLVVCGLGFGLALAPVNAAVLAFTAPSVHGLSSALVVVARMVGMLVGVSALTAVGLHRYYAVQADFPAVREVCDGRSRCAEFTLLLKEAGIAQETTVFAGAALVAALAALVALWVFRTATPSQVRAQAGLGLPHG